MAETFEFRAAVVRDMGLTYFKRYRMELSLTGRFFSSPELPDGYRLLPWHDDLLAAHADVKYHSFCFEIDANVFPCLGEREGCHRLMREIVRRENFLPRATWLLQYAAKDVGEAEYCGTIQGVQDGNAVGAVQNIGVTRGHRGRGLGTVLLYNALVGFREDGIKRVYLEVTARNTGAVRLYHRLGFRCVKTVYKAVEVAYT